MKLLDCDWTAITQVAPRWKELPLDCKLLFIKRVESNRRLVLGRTAIDIEPLVEQGFLNPTMGGNHLLLPKELVAFRRVVRAMDRLPVFHPDPDRRPVMTAYVLEHFSYEDQYALCELNSGYGNCVRLVAKQLGQHRWLERFLAEDDYRNWESSHRSSRRDPLFFNEETFRKAKEIVVDLSEHDVNPRPLIELAGILGRRSPIRFGAAIRALMGFGLVFPGFSGPEMEISIGIWPSVHERLHRIVLPPPEPVAPAQQLDVAFLIHDMTTLLVASAAEPIRLRAKDYGLFARVVRDVGDRIIALPEWLTAAVTYTPESRLEHARAALQQMGLCKVKGSSGKDLAIVPTKRGETWLPLSDGERLKSVLDGMRKDLKADRRHRYHFYDDDEEVGFSCFGRTASVMKDREYVDVRGIAIDVFAACSGGAPVRLSEFLNYHAEEENPFVRMQDAGETLSVAYEWYVDAGVDDERLVAEWREMLAAFFVDRLVPLGCAVVGVTGAGELTLSITQVGRYLAGVADDFSYGHTEQHDVVVQPNFEVVFLSASPSAEAALAQVAERVGSGLGVLFKVTRKSVFEATANGLEADAIVERLASVSSKPIPKNVSRQICDWAGQCRKVEVSTAVLFECPDKETALKVKSVGGKKLSLISETVVALTDRKALRGIEKKLRKNGITRG